MSADCYWTRSPSPELLQGNASYWESDHANTVYTTGKKSAGTSKSPEPTAAPTENRDPRKRKKSSKFSTDIVSKQREPPLDKPDVVNPDNIELHRSVHETDREWRLKRQFLLEYCDSMPADKLQCLAQVFINVECLGATYPKDVMERVREMSTFIGEELSDLRDKKRIKIEFVNASEQPKRIVNKTSETKKNKPIAFVKPTVEIEVKDDVEVVEEPISLPEEKESGKKRGRKNRKLSGGKQTDFMEQLLKNKRTLAKNESEEMVYDLAYALAKIRLENRAPKNPVEVLYMAATWCKTTLEFHYEVISLKQNCFVLSSAVVLAIGIENSKKNAKRRGFELALEKLSKPYLRVSRVNPERQELQSSDVPFSTGKIQPSLAILGGGEVARRGMKTHSKTRDDFILVDYSTQESNNAATILQQSADFNKIPIKWEFDETPEKSTCKIFIDHVEFHSYTSRTKQLAKINAAEQALEKLQQSNWTIKVKPGADSVSTGLSKDQILNDLSRASDAIPESNIGSKLLKKMGWTGGGVGKTGQGISEPIQADTTLVRRQGFGMTTAARDFKNKVKMTLNEYCSSNRQDDLQFTPEFSNEERAVVHTEARKLGLRSRSYGQGEERYLVVGRKRSPTQLLAHIMGQGGSTSKYDLVAPSNESSS